MNFLETREFAISTLSPVHIGCGEDYEPTNYVIDFNTLYAFDPALLLAKLEQRQRDELSRCLDDKQPLLAAQRFFYRHKALAIEIAGHRCPVTAAVAKHYAARVGQVANREQSGGTVINKLEIARTAFNPCTGLPILPGSSLKGAMRTAILEALRKESGAQYPLADRDAANPREASKKASEMERALMGGSFETDPLRLVKISDAAFQPGSYKLKNTAGEEIQREREPRTILFGVNRKKRPNQFEARGPIATLESVPAGQPRAFAGQLVIEHKAGAGEKTPRRQIDFGFLARACNGFFLAQLEAELALLEQNGFVSAAWAKNVRGRLAPEGIWGKPIAERRGFMLRVGRHSGAESVAIDAPRKIKIMKGQGQSEWASAATTVWLAAQEPGGTKDMLPFGWVFVQAKQQ